jgi:hypothetical protein
MKYSGGEFQVFESASSDVLTYRSQHNSQGCMGPGRLRRAKEVICSSLSASRAVILSSTQVSRAARQAQGLLQRGLVPVFAMLCIRSRYAVAKIGYTFKTRSCIQHRESMSRMKRTIVAQDSEYLNESKSIMAKLIKGDDKNRVDGVVGCEYDGLKILAMVKMNGAVRNVVVERVQISIELGGKTALHVCETLLPCLFQLELDPELIVGQYNTQLKLFWKPKIW